MQPPDRRDEMQVAFHVSACGYLLTPRHAIYRVFDAIRMWSNPSITRIIVQLLLLHDRTRRAFNASNDIIAASDIIIWRFRCSSARLPSALENVQVKLHAGLPTRHSSTGQLSQVAIGMRRIATTQLLNRVHGKFETHATQSKYIARQPQVSIIQ